MSLQAGRVGVRNDQVDVYGRVNPNSDFIVNLLKDLPAWTDLPVWKNGSEQLLPVNDDEPDTSPILCDIEYPVADLKNDQYFTYRQSPTQKDGRAKIRGIRGKTLVWNQLCDYSRSTQTVNYVTYTNNGDGSCTINGTASATSLYQFTEANILITNNHKYLFKGADGGSSNCRLDIRKADSTIISGTINTGTDVLFVAEETVLAKIMARVGSDVTVSNVIFKPQLYDLTLMFGEGKEPSTVKEFTDLFSLSYYKYDAGSLLDFTGTKVKTTGNNLSDIGNILSTNTGYVNKATSTLGYAIKGSTYTLSFKNLTTLTANFKVRITPDGTSINIDQTNKNLVASGKCTFTFTASDTGIIWLSGQVSGYTSVKVFDEVQLEYGSTATDYEIYTDNETELPTSTFFPTGMKSALAVYDELTPTRAITRIGQVDLGTLTWTYDSSNTVFRGAVSGIKRQEQTVQANILCSLYEASTQEKVISQNKNMAISTLNWGDYVVVRNSSYNDAAAFKTAMSGVMLNYELAVEDVQPTMSFDSE